MEIFSHGDLGFDIRAFFLKKKKNMTALYCLVNCYLMIAGSRRYTGGRWIA
jgi:hypothetical protein